MARLDCCAWCRCGEYNIEQIAAPVGGNHPSPTLVIVLALDSTSRAGSVAILADGRLLVEQSGDAAQTHGERLPRDLERALDTAGLTLDAVELLAVTAGPGSFTGLRVGIAAIQGVAMATGVPVVAVSALDALAVAAAGGTTLVATWIDAQRGEVFAALYAADGVRVLVDPSSRTPERTLTHWHDWLVDEPVRFIGDGARRYAAEITARLGAAVEIVDAPPLAGVIARIAAAAPERAVLPHAIVPLYIRRPDAELARERRARP